MTAIAKPGHTEGECSVVNWVALLQGRTHTAARNSFTNQSDLMGRGGAVTGK